MRVLVTGGTGFIGSHLAADARRRGAEVIVLGLTDYLVERQNAAWLESQGIEVVSGSVTDASVCAAAMQGVTHVHHLAVAMREAAIDDAYFDAVNVEGTRHLLAAAHAAGVRRFTYCGTIGVFGHRAPGITCEGSPLAPGNAYERTKLAGGRRRTAATNAGSTSPRWRTASGVRRSSAMWSRMSLRTWSCRTRWMALGLNRISGGSSPANAARRIAF